MFGFMRIASAETERTCFPFELHWAGVTELSDETRTIKPAGSTGFIKVGEDGHYYSGNQKLRFIGVQIPPVAGPKDAEILGKRLAGYGFNLWRTYPPYVIPGAKQAVDRFDGFFAAMKLNGIYTYLQLHGGGRLLRTASGNPKFMDFFGLSKKHIKDLKKGRWNSNHPDILLVYLMEPTIVQTERKSWRLLLEHVNSFTKLAYKDEPGILCIELTNECYLLGVWEMGMLGLGVFPEYYEGYFGKLWNEYLIELIQKELNHEESKNTKKNILPLPSQTAKEKLSLKKAGKDLVESEDQMRGVLEARWDDGSGIGLLEDEDPVAGTVKRLPERPQRDKGNKFSRTRTLDLMAFYAFLQKRYFEESRKYLREIGCKVPVVAGNWSQLSLPGLETLEGMDVVDTHLYFDIPVPQTRQGRYRNHNMFETYGLRNNESVLASNALKGKAFSVSETGWCYPNEYQCQFLPNLTAYASLQDWDALILFIHAPKPGDGIGNGSYPDDSFEMNPLTMTQAFIAARVFRQGLVKSAEKEIVFSYPQGDVRSLYLESLTGHGVWPAAPYPLGILSNENSKGSLPFEIALKHRVRKRFLDGGHLSIGIENGGGKLPEFRELSKVELKALAGLNQADFIASDTKEILSDKRRQLLLVDALEYKTITGRLEGRIRVDSGEFSVEMSEPRYGSLSLLALDGKPILESGRMLLSTVARVRNTGMKWDEDKHHVKEWGKGPVLCENVPGKVSIRIGEGRRPVVWALDGGGRKTRRVPCEMMEGKVSLEIGREETIWYLVEIRGWTSEIRGRRSDELSDVRHPNSEKRGE